MSRKHTTPNDSVHLYMSQLSSRVVAESGIPTDRFHFGKLIWQSLKDAPDFILQIDGATGQTETNASVLERSIRCAASFKTLGLKEGDAIVVMAPLHIDVSIPIYAALFLGVIVSTIDLTLGPNELYDTFKSIKPKLVFCQSDKVTDVQKALNELKSEAQIISFDKRVDKSTSFAEFISKHGLNSDVVKTFKSRHVNFPTPTRCVLIVSPLQWLTALIHIFMCPIFRIARVQSSSNMTRDHAYSIINKYKPTFVVLSPSLMTTLIKPGVRDACDFSSFEHIMIGGSAVTIELVKEVKSLAVNAEVFIAYGMSELAGFGFLGVVNAPASVGRLLGCLQHKLIDMETSEEITDPNKPGELWLKGPVVFKEYHNNPQATNDTFEGEWLKTGDMFYRDENWNFYFVDRIKLLLKYKNHQISPVELEAVIRQHPEVMDVAVTGLPDPECGELPVACVVLKNNNTVTPQEIKDIVKKNLTDTKQLRGGVMFLDELPTSTSTKLHRRKLKEIVIDMGKKGKLL